MACMVNFYASELQTVVNKLIHKDNSYFVTHLFSCVMVFLFNLLLLASF